MTEHFSEAKTFEILTRVVAQYQAAADNNHYVVQKFTHSGDKVFALPLQRNARYARINIGGSGAFMIDLQDGSTYGHVFGIKGYGKVDRAKDSGNIFDPAFSGTVLVRDRFRWGRFINNSDGTLAQPIVRR